MIYKVWIRAKWITASMAWFVLKLWLEECLQYGG